MFLIFKSFSAEAKTSVALGSLTIHGVPNANGAWEGMPRKLDDNGRSVFTPGISLMVENDWNYTGAILKDCFDHWAGTVLIGASFYKNTYVDLNWSVGIYFREVPYYLDYQGNRYLAVDSLPFLKVGQFQVIPIGFVGISPMPNWVVSPVIMTNGILTNFSLKFTF